MSRAWHTKNTFLWLVVNVDGTGVPQAEAFMLVVDQSLEAFFRARQVLLVIIFMTVGSTIIHFQLLQSKQLPPFGILIIISFFRFLWKIPDPQDFLICLEEDI